MSYDVVTLDPLYSASRPMLLQLLSECLTHQKTILSHENQFTITYNGQPIEAQLSRDALILEKAKYSTLPKAQRPQYVLFVNLTPLGSGAFGSAHNSSVYFKYAPGHWSEPLKVKFSLKYILKHIKKTNQPNANAVDREHYFNQEINGQSFMPIQSQQEFYLPIKCEAGITLYSLIQRLKLNPNFLTPLQYYALAHSLLSELANIHKLNFIHCDIKPSNIMVDLNALRMHLIDFGLMKQAGEQSGFRGSLLYSDPECLYNRKEPNEISDVFSAVICLLELFGQYQHDTLFTEASLKEYNLNINTERACLNIKTMSAEEIRLIRSTLHNYTRFAQDKRQSDISALIEVFNNLMIARFNNPNVSDFEKINSTMITEAINQWGQDVVLKHINNQFHLFNLCCLEALVTHGVKLSETDVLSKALREDNVDFYKLRRLHELGATFSEEDFNYWLNERPINNNDIQAWAEICLYLYAEGSYHHYPTCHSEAKQVFVDFFLNPETPWQDVDIGKKIFRHLELHHRQTAHIADIENILDTELFKNTAFATVVKAEIMVQASKALLSNDAPIVVLADILKICQNFKNCHAQCMSLSTQPEIKALVELINSTINDTTLSVYRLYTANNDIITKLIEIKEQINEKRIVKKITDIPIDNLSSAAIDYCIDINNALSHLELFRKNELNTSYANSIQNMIYAAITNFNPNIAINPLFVLKIITNNLFSLSQIINALCDITDIKDLIIASLPSMLITVDSDEQLLSIIKLCELLNQGLSTIDICKYKTLILDNIEPTFSGIKTLLERVERFNHYRIPIIRFLQKITLYERTLISTPSWMNFRQKIFDCIRRLITDGGSFLSLNYYLEMTILLEQFVIDNIDYQTDWHKRIYECCAMHVHNLTRASYNALQKKVTNYLLLNPSPDDEVLKAVFEHITLNDLYSAINALTTLSSARRIILWESSDSDEEDRPKKKQRLLEPGIRL